MKNWLAVLAVLVVGLTAACGGGGGVSGPGPTPTPVPVPQVAGSYAGTANVVFPEVGESATCPVASTVRQAGNIVNIGSIVGGGRCAGMEFPAVEVTIDSTAAIIGGASGTYRAACGTYNYTITGGFSGATFRLIVNATSTTCFNYNFTGNLSR